MRLFTAIDLAPNVRGNLETLVASLRPAARLSWSAPRNLHITTKFIGEWPDSRLEEMIAALESVPSPGPMAIAIRRLGWFPNERSPRVFWAGVEAPPALAELARATEKRVRGLGVPVENRPFAPHLTLARIRTPQPLAELHRAIAALNSTDFGEFDAAEFHLYRSQLAPSGSIYTRLASFSLAGSRAGASSGT